MVQKTSSSKQTKGSMRSQWNGVDPDRTISDYVPKKEVVKSIMALGCSRREAEKLLDESSKDFAERFRQVIKEENASLRGKRGSAGR